MIKIINCNVENSNKNEILSNVYNAVEKNCFGYK